MQEITSLSEVAFGGDRTNPVIIKNSLVLDKSDMHHHLRNPSIAETDYNCDILQVTLTPNRLGLAW
jgi:hypothetical protein